MIAIAALPPMETNLSASGFNLAFLVTLGAGFALGILASYIGNYFWDRHKEKTTGKGRSYTITSSGPKIQYQVQGQVPNTAENLNSILKNFQRFGWSEPAVVESKSNTWVVFAIIICILIILGIIAWRYFV